MPDSTTILKASARVLILTLCLLTSCVSPTTDVKITGQLLRMSDQELDTLFRKGRVGNIPNGEGKGTAIIKPGSSISDDIARFVHRFTWKGKVFDAAKGELRNKILPLGHKAIVAKVYKDKSWLDQKECIVLDYSKTSVVAHWVRDEIREVAPGIYLGIVYWEKSGSSILRWNSRPQINLKSILALGEKLQRIQRPRQIATGVTSKQAVDERC